MKKITAFIIALFSIFIVRITCQAQVSLQIVIAPPPIQVYDQPDCPVDGYIWTPGYWAYGSDGYYWIPGSWLEPTEVGFLWTPGYWDYSGGYYGWHKGYWGSYVGYYGGVNYGYGYVGSGYVGGRWEGGHFNYNTAVSNVSASRSHNTYLDRTVSTNNTAGRSSFHGKGGAAAQQGTHTTITKSNARNSVVQQPAKASTPTHANINRTIQHSAEQHTSPPARQQQAPQRHTNQPSRQQQAPQQHASQPTRQQAPQEQHGEPRGGERHPR